MTHFPDTSQAPDELVTRAAAGPHRHWSPFDLKLEGARFQRLHDIVSAKDFDPESASEVLSQIMAFARGYGDGQADSYLADVAGIEDETLAEIMQDDLFSSYDQTEYFQYVSKSARILFEASVTDEAKAAVRDLTVDALDAFCSGRDVRMEKSDSPSLNQP
jgi:hypothetical protein